MGFLRDAWNFKNNTKPSLFYDDLASLNDFFDSGLASPEILKNMQIINLRNNYSNKGQSYEILNNFLKDLLGTSQGTDEDLFAKLVQGINKGLDEFRTYKNRENKNWIQDRKNGIYFKELEDIISQIENLINSISGDEGISAPSLDLIKASINNRNKQDFIAAKGQFLEDIGAWIIQRAGLAGFTTGAWQAQDMFFNEDTSASIIEDAMGLLLKDDVQFVNSGNNFLSLKIQGYKQMNRQNQNKVNAQLQNWIDSIKELNGLQVLDGEVTVGSNISSPQDFVNLIRLINSHSSNVQLNLSINLSTNLYQEIQKLSVNIQSKSNIERHLVNNGKRSLYHMIGGEYDKLVTFSKMKPVIQKSAVNSKEFEEKYKEFSAYVNYNLSQNINKTVYARNEFYLTKEGFSDLATLMEKRGFYIRIKDTMLSYKEFLQNSFETIYS